MEWMRITATWKVRFAHLVLRFLQSVLGDLVEFFENVDLNWTSLPTANVVQYSIDRFLRVISSNSRFSICEELGVGLERVVRSSQNKKEKLCGLFEGFESPGAKSATQ
jgi:hypothetical protein